jgi:serine/threonine protein kinase/Tfp pilus assembly protein PilF
VTEEAHPHTNWTEYEDLVGRNLGSCRIEKLLGRGGMGAVFHGTHEILNKQVAIKVLAPESMADSTHVERFLREARAIARIDHPNVVAVYDVYFDDQVHGIIMQLVQGEDLGTRLRREGEFPVYNALHYCAQAALGLEAAHEMGILHRDMKPGNLLVDAEDHLLVSDFGLAHNCQDDIGLTKTGSTVGTAHYISPEQAQGLGADERSDIYSLGCTLFTILAGRNPYSGDTPVAVAMAHVDAEIPNLGRLRPDLPTPVVDIVRDMMAKNPIDRPQSAAEASTLLEGLKTAKTSASGANRSLSKRKSSASARRSPTGSHRSRRTTGPGVRKNRSASGVRSGGARRKSTPGTPQWVPLLIGALILIVGLFLAFRSLSKSSPSAPDNKTDKSSSSRKNRTFQRALQAYETGRLNEARKGFLQIEPNNKRYGLARAYAGRASYALKQHQQGLELLQESASSGSAPEWTELYLGLCLAALQRTDDALTHIDRIADHPDLRLQALPIRIDLALQKNNLTLALSDASQLRRLKASDAQEKLATVHKTIQEQGATILQNGQWEKACELGSAWIRADPNFYFGYLLRGMGLDRKGKNEEALKLLGKAIQIGPRSLHIEYGYYHRGFLLLRKHRYRSALRDFQDVIKQRPIQESPASILLPLGLAYLGAGQTQEAYWTLSAAQLLGPPQWNKSHQRSIQKNLKTVQQQIGSDRPATFDEIQNLLRTEIVVVSSSPSKNGLKKGDIILDIRGTEVRSILELQQAARSQKGPISGRVRRKSQIIEVTLPGKISVRTQLQLIR